MCTLSVASVVDLVRICMLGLTIIVSLNKATVIAAVGLDGFIADTEPEQDDLEAPDWLQADDNSKAISRKRRLFDFPVGSTIDFFTEKVPNATGNNPDGETEVVDLETPEWLQNIPEESKVAKYRQRRFLTFPDGTTLSIAFAFSAPTEGLDGSGTFSASNTWTLDLSESGILGRSNIDKFQRKAIYDRLEDFYEGMGHNGRSCILRTICEVADLPFNHGVLGEIVNLILLATTGSNELTGGENLSDEYVLAEYYGRTYGNCWKHYPECHVSFTNLLSSTRWLN